MRLRPQVSETGPFLRKDELPDQAQEKRKQQTHRPGLDNTRLFMSLTAGPRTQIILSKERPAVRQIMLHQEFFYLPGVTNA
jgi:hypothetical protein